MKHKPLGFLAVVILALTLWLLQNRISPAQNFTAFDSPILTPPAPTPTPTLPSAEAQKALQYISEREGIPVEEMFVVNDLERTFPFIGRTFREVLILDDRTDHGQEYYVLVDLADGRIEEDWEAIEAAEETAYQSKYGKLHPSLYKRLQEVGDDDLLPIAIWMAPNATVRTQEEVYAELATRYPEAAVALEREGTPWAVDDPSLADEIRQAYRQMRAADTAVRIDPLVDHLGRRGFEARTYGAMPSVSAFLPKKVIVALAGRDDVGFIYLIEEQGSDAMDTAGPTDRASVVWQRGFDGSGVRVAIMENDNVDDNIDCLDVVATRPGLPRREDQHAAMVASVVACDHDTYRGIAPGAQIIDARYDNTGGPGGASQEDAVETLKWAIQDEEADVVNVSQKWEVDNNLNWLDRAFDYWAREEREVIVVAAGNSGGSLDTPAKGWNVISVGGSDDNQTSVWSDDEMTTFSSWVNPVGIHREKPEVVAPAFNIKTIGRNGNFDTDSGTSFATPQVTGLAALLIDRRGSLSVWPPAVKAIIMASAVHNITGPSDIPTGQDLRDGAGAIDAALADEIAKKRWYSSSTPCDGPCWWGITTSSSNPSAGGSLYRYFNASRGERVRVAISWYSNADPPLDHPDLARDELDTNYNLYVYAPNGSLVGYTASDDNNYELVEFTALKTGKYKIRVYRSSRGDNNESSNHLGIAWVKDATYLPHVKSSEGGYGDGWDSEIVIRNDGAEPRDVTVELFHPDGYPAGGATHYGLGSNAIWAYDPSHSNFTGSAIVSGGEDLSVVVEHQKNNERERTNYTGILPDGSSGSLGWEQAGTTLYAPVIKRQRYGRSSTIHVVNAGSQATTVKVYYYNDSGTARWGGSYALDPNSMATISPSGGGSGGCNATGSVCSARIYTSNGQPLAGVVREYNDADGLSVTTHNMFNAGAATIYFPIVKYERYDMSTGLRIQNVGAAGTSVTVDYYQQNGAWACSLSASISRYTAKTFFDSTCPGSNFSGNALASASQPLVGMANEVSSDGRYKKGYSSALGGSQTAYGPLVYRSYSQNGHTWDAGIAVRNLSTQSASVNLYYYHSSGALAGQQLNQTINGRGTGVYFAPVSGFKGSVLITANRAVAAIVNVVNDASSGDTHAIYNASNR